ncbi:hypothetical protein [Thalassobacillus pellis]|uniref:hypothetical protein n=1 Tax=Thalassobacillus pellis TaxID=748008 RepID=UPI0019621CB8|nr:hypothetical protein [Thalassobacillus pellis]MBM7554158.1 hypothetical protein [Thalassobacillus pellis]
MKAPDQILATWRKFDDFPMETLTKLWFFHQSTQQKQRSVALMKEHRETYGITGNCFDLALWLLDEFKQDGIEAYPIGSNLDSSHVHVAVIALDIYGNRFLCDLGDQWLEPILIEPSHPGFIKEPHSGFFPAADVQITTDDLSIEVNYHRPNGKKSQQFYETKPIEIDYFLKVAEGSQQNIHPIPLLECRIPYKNEMAHWEFDDWKSVLSTTSGLINDPPINTIDEWVARIGSKTRYKEEFLREVLLLYQALR